MVLHSMRRMPAMAMLQSIKSGIAWLHPWFQPFESLLFPHLITCKNIVNQKTSIVNCTGKAQVMTKKPACVQLCVIPTAPHAVPSGMGHVNKKDLLKELIRSIAVNPSSIQ